MLRILADENIASATEAFKEFGKVRTISGRRIDAKLLWETDVLLVRSVTRVDGNLLSGSPVKFVGSATAGLDHIAAADIQGLGIRLAHAPGSNAPSVADYVVAGIIRLANAADRRLTELTCAVIGCGAVGSRVANRLEGLGLQVLRSDPPLRDDLGESRGSTKFVDTDHAIAAADIITVHVPLHDTPPYSTAGLFDKRRFDLLKPDAWLINTSRGLVVDEPSCERWRSGHPGAKVISDVWAHEPNLSCTFAAQCEIATPHIAGYAIEGKLRATHMLSDSLRSWLQMPAQSRTENQGYLGVTVPVNNSDSPEQWLDAVTREMYDINQDHERLSSICGLDPSERGPYFDRLRKQYPTRHEFSRFGIPAELIPHGLNGSVSEGLGITIIE